DSPASRPDGIVAAALFEDGFFGDMVGEDEMRPVADQKVLAHGNLARAKLVDFSQKRLRFDYHPRGDHRDDSRSQKTHRQKRQLVRLTMTDDGMTGVIAPLITHDDVMLV